MAHVPCRLHRSSAILPSNPWSRDRSLSQNSASSKPSEASPKTGEPSPKTGEANPSGLPRRAYVTFGLTALTLLMSAIDGFIVAVGFPTIRTDLGANLALVGWVFTGFQLATIIVLPLAGKLSDELGRKRLFLAAVALFTVSSLVCGIAPNVYVLIVGRVVQGIAAGAIWPSTTGIVSDAFGARRATALGLFSSIYPIGAVLGPNIGGVLIEHLSWRWIFFVNLPIGVAILALGYFILPASPRKPREKIDFFGAATYGTGLFLLLYGLACLANNADAFLTAPFWLCIGASVVLMIVFLRHEKRTPAPMIDLELLASRPFLAMNLYGFIYGACVFGTLAFLPLHAQLTYGMGPAESGFVLTPRALIMSATSTTAAFMLARTGFRLPMILGVVVQSVAMVLLSFGLHDIIVSDLILMCAILALSGIGNGMALPSMNNAGLDLAPNKIAAISGLRGVFNSTGGVVGAGATIVVMSHFKNEGDGLQVMLFILAIFLLFTIPLTFLFADGGRRKQAG